MPELKQLLSNAVKKSIGKQKKVAVLFSGGLDSSVIAKLASEYSSITLFTIGFSKSKDIVSAENIAKEMNLPLVLKRISKNDVSTAYPIVKKILKKNKLDNFLQFQIGLSEYLAFISLKEKGFTYALSGLGADTMFMGFSYFKEMLLKEGEKGIEKYVKNQLKKELFNIDVKRVNAISSYLGIKLSFPYLDQKVIREALKIPISENIHSSVDDVRKHVLRTVAGEIGVPVEAVSRPKSAIQYGTGIAKELQKMLKN